MVEEWRVRKSAYEYLRQLGYSEKCFVETENGWGITAYGKLDFLDKIGVSPYLKFGKAHNATKAVEVLAGYIEPKEAADASWYPDETKPKAKLILDDCGVKTYEVEGAPHERFATDTSKVWVECRFSMNGRTYHLFDGDGYSVFDQNANTAKQALENLGYEVEE